MLVLLLVILSMGVVVPASSLTVGGRLTTSLYTYEGQQADSSFATHLRAYQGVRLDLGRLGHPGLSLHTYAQGTRDITEEAKTDPRLRIYNAYLAWNQERYYLQLGRQRIYAGVGYGSIDGLRGHLALDGVDIAFYAGTLVPLNKSADVSTWSEGHLWGGKINTDRFFDTALSLSFASHEREPEPHTASGRSSLAQAGPAAVVRRLIGVDARHGFRGGHSLYGRLDYDLKDEAIRRREVSARYIVSPRLNVQAEWFHRQPSIFYNSIFSVFPSKGYQEVSGRLYYRLNANLRLSTSFAAVLYDDDAAQRVGLVATLGEHYSVGYYRTMGYARASDGLVGNVYYPLNRKLLLRGALDLAAYERFEEADDREELVTGSLGLTYRPTRRAFIELQAQGLRNPADTSDMRLLLRGSWRFFKGER